MDIDYPEYKLQCYANQLQKACKYRGYDSCRTISSFLNIKETRLQLLETGEVAPDLRTFITLANFLKLDLCYFCLPDALPEHFDLQGIADDAIDTIV